MKQLCTILARGGSKGVSNKNIREICGKPLLAWTVELAASLGIFELVAVSSDSDQILEIAVEFGADLVVSRPPELATDDAPKMPALLHCVLQAESYIGATFDTIIDLQPTSPLRTKEDIVNAIKIQSDNNASSVITGSEARCSPYFSLVEERSDGTVEISKNADVPVYRRQDSPRCYDMNGSIYVFERDKLIAERKTIFDDTRLLSMPRERSVDIDDELDFLIAEYLMGKSTIF